MFDKNDRGERCWNWEGRFYEAPFPQKEIAHGEGWSLHLRKKGRVWTNYCLYTKEVFDRQAWHLSIGKGVFARTDHYRLLGKKNSAVLKWVMDAHGGKIGDFPSIGFLVPDPEKRVRKRAVKGVGDPFPEDRRKMLMAMVKAQEEGKDLVFSDRGWSIFDCLGAYTMATKNVARDFLDEMILVEAIAITPKGYKVVESDLEKISDLLRCYGIGNRKRRQYGRRKA